MLATPRRNKCRCPNCCGKCPEFQKVMDIEEFGLTFYRYVRRICKDEDASAVEPYDVFILHSTNVNKVTAVDYLPALDWKRIQCLRCQEIAKKAQILFQNVQSIRAKGLRGICDLCYSLQDRGSCFECQKTIIKFITNKRIQASISKNVISTAQTRSETKSSIPSLTTLKKLTRSQSVPKRDIKIEEMFEANKLHTDNLSIHSTDTSVSDIRNISEHSSIEMVTLVKDVKFGPVSEIKKSLLETIAELDDRSISMLVRHIIDALKEKIDEIGKPVLNAKLVADKSDEELEQLVLQAINSGNYDMQMQILELIDVEESAYLHFLQIGKRLEQKYFKAEDINTPETKLTTSDSKLHVPQTQVTKSRGSLEKIINKEVTLEETRVKNQARRVATLIRKEQLDNHLKKLLKVTTTDPAIKEDERTRNLIELVKYKLQMGKIDASKTKKKLSSVGHKLFSPVSQTAVDNITVTDKEIHLKSLSNLKPILKGSKKKKKPILDTTEQYRQHPLHAKSKFQYDFYQESEIHLQPRMASSAELIDMMKKQIEETKMLHKKTDGKLSKAISEKSINIREEVEIKNEQTKVEELDQKVQQSQKISPQKSKYRPHREIEYKESQIEQLKLQDEEKETVEHEQRKEPEKNAQKDSKNLNIDVIKQLEKVMKQQEKLKISNLKLYDRLAKKEKKYRAQADKALDAQTGVHLPSITTTPKKKLSSPRVIVKEDRGEQYAELPFKKIRLKGPSDDDLILKMVKTRLTKYPKIVDKGKENFIQEILEKRHAKRKKREEIIRSYSDDELDSVSLLPENSDKGGGMIVGNTILNPTETANYILSKKEKEGQLLPSVFKTAFEVPEPLQIKPQKENEPVEINKAKNKIKVVSSDVSGNSVIRYQLSNTSYIDNGWTQLPVQQVFRKVNVYRMYPARFNWFERNSDKGRVYYSTGELLASVDDVGHGRWFYKNGNIALDFYDTEDLSDKQRIVIYSSGEPEGGCPRPVTVLGSFDYNGNGVIMDHIGNVRMKYNQSEGLLLDKKIGPLSHWKWHALNEPPTFQQLWVEPKERHLDPRIMNLDVLDINKIRPSTTDMERTAIELENSVKEQHLAKGQEFKPFPIQMKTLKINDQFTLKVIDQANIYVTFSDGAKKLKLNLGMMLDPSEIVNIETLEVKPAGQLFESYLERCPAPTQSLDRLQYKIENAKKFEKGRIRRDQRIRPTLPVDSTDLLTAALSLPLRVPLRTLSQQSSCIGII